MLLLFAPKHVYTKEAFITGVLSIRGLLEAQLSKSGLLNLKFSEHAATNQFRLH